MAVLVASQGRELQRYSTSTGGRIVVGCIPYRLRCDDGELEVLVISSQKGHGMKFPKGGWELDESMDDAARHEALEEAGVHGATEKVLGRWYYQSRRYDQTYEGFMFPLQVTDELHQWPEMASRKRTWATVQQVMDGCQHGWMREALEPEQFFKVIPTHTTPKTMNSLVNTVSLIADACLKAEKLPRALISCGVVEAAAALCLVFSRLPSGIFLHHGKVPFYLYYCILTLVVILGFMEASAGFWVAGDVVGRRAAGKMILWVSIVPLVIVAALGGFIVLNLK